MTSRVFFADSAGAGRRCLSRPLTDPVAPPRSQVMWHYLQAFAAAGLITTAPPRISTRSTPLFPVFSTASSFPRLRHLCRSMSPVHVGGANCSHRRPIHGTATASRHPDRDRLRGRSCVPGVSWLAESVILDYAVRQGRCEGFAARKRNAHRNYNWRAAEKASDLTASFPTCPLCARQVRKRLSLPPWRRETHPNRLLDTPLPPATIDTFWCSCPLPSGSQRIANSAIPVRNPGWACLLRARSHLDGRTQLPHRCFPRPAHTRTAVSSSIWRQVWDSLLRLRANAPSAAAASSARVLFSLKNGIMPGWIGRTDLPIPLWPLAND